MMLPWDTPVGAATWIALAIFSIAVCICLVRLTIGPTLPDRVVALDMVGTLLVGLLIVFGIAGSQPDAVRVATVLALINFVGTVGFALYTSKRAKQ